MKQRVCLKIYVYTVVILLWQSLQNVIESIHHSAVDILNISQDFLNNGWAGIGKPNKNTKYNKVQTQKPRCKLNLMKRKPGLKIKCNVFLFVEVNFSPSVFNINKSITVLRKITKITNLLKKRFKVRHRRSVYMLQMMTSYRENNDDDDQLK